MEVSYHQLKNRYSQLSTDELLAIYSSSDLTDTAKSLLEAEISERGVTSHEIADAISDAKGLEQVREIGQRRAWRHIWWFAFVFLLLGLVPIIGKLYRLLSD